MTFGQIILEHFVSISRNCQLNTIILPFKKSIKEIKQQRLIIHLKAENYVRNSTHQI
jgi:hypothetical protein